VPLVPLPTDKITAPPRPAVDAPEPIQIEPLFPLLLVPVLKKSAPLTPFSPVFKLRITTAPLDEAVPSPDMMRTAPPVKTVLRPPLI
jgi:hypothetical protein